MARLPIDTPQRKIGSKARAIVHYQINADHWDYHEETGCDFGRDCTIELIQNECWNNDKIEGQIKGTTNLTKLKSGDISFPIDTKTLNYALGSGNPFVFFLVDVNTECVYYLAIQDYFIANWLPTDKLADQDTLSVHISCSCILSESDDDLIQIAKSRYAFAPPDKLRKTSV